MLKPLLLKDFTIECHTNVTFMFHKCTNLEKYMVTNIWNKFHIFMKSGRLPKVIKLSGISQ